MIIRRLALRDFRRFASYEATFCGGFNVILGRNEEGKSTLREAITLALFQDPKTTKKEVLSWQRWGAARLFAIELEFEAVERSYRLVKDFEAKTVRLEEHPSGAVLEDARAVEAKVKDLLGLGSRGLFESTVRISQRDVTVIQNGQDIADSIQKTLTGGEQGAHASKVLAELDRAINGLKTAARANPGPLSALPVAIDDRLHKASRLRGALARVEQAGEKLREKKELLQSVREELHLKQELQRDCAERLRLEDELEKDEQALERLESRIGEAQRLEGRIERAERDLARQDAVLALSPEQAAEITMLEKQAAFTAPPARPQTAAASRLAPVLALAGLTLAAVGLLAGLLWLVAIGLGAAVLGWSRWASPTRKAERIAEEMRLKQQQEAAVGAARQLSEVLSAIGCPTAAEFRQRRQTVEELQRGLIADKAKLEGLLGDENSGDLEDRRKEIARRTRDRRHRLDEPEMRLATMDHIAYQRLGQDISRSEATVESTLNEMTDLEMTVRANRAPAEEVFSLEEEVQELRERLAAAEERHRVLSLTRKVLEEARGATIGWAKDTLQNQLGELVADITAGRYSRLTVDGKLEIRLLSPEREEPVGVELEGALSTGTVEQVYLAARLAIARLLAGNRHPPLILDDPFVSYDAGRTEAVLALCQRLSAENQVLLFTCREADTYPADNVVQLPGLSAAATRRSG